MTAPAAQRGTLLLADISGYTAFLQGVAAAHAEDMASGTFVPEAYPLLSSLLDGIVERVVPPFLLAKLEGDAVFAYGSEDPLAPARRCSTASPRATGRIAPSSTR